MSTQYERYHPDDTGSIAKVMGGCVITLLVMVVIAVTIMLIML